METLDRDVRITLYKTLRKLGVKKEEIEIEASYENDLQLDDIDMKCLYFYLETKFDIDIKDEELPQIYSIGNTIDYINHKIRA